MRQTPDKDAGVQPPLNPQQLAAVRHSGSPLFVLAGAGSGKTRVIIHKIAHLISRVGYRPEHIAAVTFTQKAAREMRQRCAGLLGKHAAKIHISTFHSLGLRLLREEYHAAGLKKNFSILDPESARILIAGELASGRDNRPETVLAAQYRISEWKTNLVPPEVMSREPYGGVYAGYMRQLHATSSVDFDDLIAVPALMLETDPALAERWRGRLHYLLVDEYQDTNAAQYRLLKALAGPSGAFTVVGDDDQSIYAWRGARPENLRDLGKDYPTLAVIKLELNYRSTDTILRAANALIANNPHLYEKQLRSALGQGDRIRVVGTPDGEGEAARIAAEILDLHHHGVPYQDIAVLYRGNHQSRPIERALADARILYRVSGGTAWFDRAEIRDLLAYMRLIANPEDDAAFLRIANIPRRDIGTATLEGLGVYAHERSISLFSACFEMGLAATLPPRGCEAVARFAHLLSRLAERAEREPAHDVAVALIEETGYRTWIEEQARDEREREKRRASLSEFLAWIVGGDKNMTLAERLRLLALAEAAERERSEDPASGQVQLMTLHAAKGLEFHTVFLAGMEEGLLPHRSSIEQEAIDEERRLAYVGLTRARRRLYITHAERRRKYGQWVECEPSRFLGELPEDLLEWDRPGSAEAEERKQSAANHHLAAMRALISE